MPLSAELFEMLTGRVPRLGPYRVTAKIGEGGMGQVVN